MLGRLIWRTAIGALALGFSSQVAGQAPGPDPILQQRLAQVASRIERLAADEAAPDVGRQAQRLERRLRQLEQELRDSGGRELEVVSHLRERLAELAPNVPPDDALQAPVGTGVITGTVTAADTGAPLSGLRVYIYNSCGVSVTSAFTDTSGIYTTSAVLDTGSYFAHCKGSSTYLPLVYPAVVCKSDFCSPAQQGTAVAVTSGSVTSNVNLPLVRVLAGPATGTISGQVRNANTLAGVASVWVYLNDARGSYVKGTYTDASGSFTLGGLAAGQFFLTAWGNPQGLIPEVYDNIPALPGYVSPLSGTPINVTTGGTTGGLLVDLSPGGRISGTVGLAGGGVPALYDSLVELYDQAGSYVTYEEPTANGTWMTSVGLPSGSYFVQADAYAYSGFNRQSEVYNNLPCAGWNHCDQVRSALGAPVAVTAGNTTPGINHSLDAGAVIGGTVTQGSSPAASAYVDVYDTSEYLVDTGHSDVAGAYAIYGLGTRTYYAKSSVPGFVPEAYNNVPCPFCSVTSGTPINAVAGSTVSGINFSLDSGTTLQGAFTDVQGRPAKYSPVVWIRGGGNWVSSTSAPACGQWHSTYAFPAGSYVALGGNSSHGRYELYNGIECGERSYTCAPYTGATPIVASGSGTLTGIDFSVALKRRPFDFDGDNYADKTVYHDAGFWFSRSSQSGLSSGFGFGGPGYTPVAADYDGDRRSDAAMYHPPTGLWFFRNDQTGAVSSLGFGGSAYLPVPSDYDGDGKTDIAAFHNTLGIWFIKQSSLGGALMSVDFGAGGGFTPVPRDYDGDGRFDLAVYSPATGLWFVRSSASGTTTSVGFGGSVYQPVPGDYDGDGKDDIAVYHKDLGLWFIRQSSLGGALLTVDFGGGPGYTPVPADFDTDGKLDLAIYSESTGLWFVKKSTTGATVSEGYGGPGYEPVFY